MIIRPATHADFTALNAIRYACDTDGETEPPPIGPIPPYLAHVAATGRLLVAERDEEVVGYAGAVERGDSVFLTDLFIRPDRQSGAVGRSLLDRVLPAGPRSRFTVSSTDHRAIALYTRYGMSPRWPNLLLEVETSGLAPLPSEALEVAPADPDDPVFAAWEAEIGGRPRPQDLAYLMRDEIGTPLWFRRAGETIGHGIVRLGYRSLVHGSTVAVGPVGARRREDAAACVLAAVDHARALGPLVELSVPGSHPALPALLSAGFRITYVETFCATRAGLIDPERYIGSGGDFF